MTQVAPLPLMTEVASLPLTIQVAALPLMTQVAPPPLMSQVAPPPHTLTHIRCQDGCPATVPPVELLDLSCHGCQQGLQVGRALIAQGHKGKHQHEGLACQGGWVG